MSIKKSFLGVLDVGTFLGIFAWYILTLIVSGLYIILAQCLQGIGERLHPRNKKSG